MIESIQAHKLELVREIAKVIYISLSIFFINYLALIYDSEWLQVAIVLDGSLVVSFTGITINNKFKK